MKNVIEYTVTVTALVRRIEPAGHEWAPKADGSEGYAYTPRTEKEVLRSVTLFEQRFETLDMSAVARMLNSRAPFPTDRPPCADGLGHSVWSVPPSRGIAEEARAIAAQLCQQQPPEFNIDPTVRAVMQVLEMGGTVVQLQERAAP